MIQLPGHVPLATTLTTQQLTALFPFLKRYSLYDPDVALLPKESMTYHGLETAIRWTEQWLRHPTFEFELDVIAGVEMYHAMYFLGRKSTDTHMKYIRKLIRAAILDGIELDEVAALWRLRKFTGAATFIRCLVKYLANVKQELEDNFSQPSNRVSVDDTSKLLVVSEDIIAAMAVISWAERKEELWNRVEVAQTLKSMQKNNLKNLRKYGYFKKKGKGVQWIANSAVQWAKMKTNLETIAEDRA
jgi:hypothetical protein